MYHNTVPLVKDELKDAQQMTKYQHQKVKNIINLFHEAKRTFTPRAIYNTYKSLISEIELTSVRRSLDTLKKEGFIKETGNRTKTYSKMGERELIKV